MNRYYHVDFDKLGRRPSIEQAQWNYENLPGYSEGNEAQFRIDDLSRSKIGTQLGEILFRQGDWVVTKIHAQ